MSKANSKIAVIGAGAWGTALALAACRAGNSAMLWAHEAETVEAINGSRENTPFLAGVSLNEGISATTDLSQACSDAALILLVTPAQHLRRIAAALPSMNASLVLCSKGIEIETGKLMSEIVAEVLPDSPTVVLSGPTFAIEVARGLPAAVTLASREAAVSETAAELLNGPTFRTYVSSDPVGAQVGGAVKNVIALACGITVGRQLGENARAALITRGLAEMVRLATALGGEAQTLMGLSGLGDLTLTCNSLQSRNMSLGAALGEGKTLAEILATRNSVAEGVASAKAVTALASRLGVDMPICSAVDRILHAGSNVESEIEGLLSRPVRAE